jgi:electron transfer flavoprotein alpha subunit
MEGRLATITKELLSCGRKLADDLAEELSAVILGDGVGDLAQRIIAHGADKVYIVDNPLLKDYRTESYTDTMEIIVKQVMPRILLMGQTSMGRDLAPRLAFRLETSATTDCIELAIDAGSKKLMQTKPIYGGNAMATFTSEYCPQIATVRHKVYSPLEADTSRQGEVITVRY